MASITVNSEPICYHIPMKITKLSRTVKNKNNINIFLDHKYWVSLHERHILDFGLYKDFEVSEELKLKLESVMSEQKILLRLQKFILRRPRSIMELQIYIKTRLEVSDVNYCNELISKLGIKDDLAFAERFIENYKLSGKVGKNKVIGSKIY